MLVAVIEDNEDVALYLETFLAQEGMDSVVVRDNFERLMEPEFWRGVDVALIDLLLGSDINGGHVLHWMQENAPHVRRVVLSAVANHVDVTECADAVLTKPASTTELRRALAGVDRG